MNLIFKNPARFVLLIWVGLLTSCSSINGSKESVTRLNKVQSESLIKQKEFLKGKTLKAKELLIGDTLNLAESMLYYYSGYDCGSCVSVGFDILNRIASQDNILVIESHSNKGQDQINYGYHKYIFSDNDDLIRKNLNFHKTPVIIFFNDDEKIIDVFYPESDMQVDDEFMAEFSIEYLSIFEKES